MPSFKSAGNDSLDWALHTLQVLLAPRLARHGVRPARQHLLELRIPSRQALGDGRSVEAARRRVGLGL
jgi:hypothetical protein